MKTLLSLVLLIGTAHAAVVISPAAIPNSTVQVKQGTIQDQLPNSNAFTVTTTVKNGTVIKQGSTNTTLTFPVPDASNPLTIWYQTNTQPPPTCPPQPAPLTQHAACPAGTTGAGWTQTATYASAPYPTCWVLGAYLPTEPPTGVCTPTGGGGGTLVPPVAQTDLIAVSKPPKGVPFTTQYGTTETRVTDHAADHSACPWMREDYSRRQSFNADKSRLLVYCGSGGAWLDYLIPGNTFDKVLNGPGADAEIQWSPTDPNTLYYLPTNGGTVLYALNVATNQSVVYYDFTRDVRALLGNNVVHSWTKSEGSPSADNRYWALQCEDGNFNLIGYIVIDTVAKSIVYSKADTNRPDHTSMTPSGRSFERSGDDSLGTQFYRISDGAVCQAHHKSEHSDVGILPNGHDFYVSIDYQTNDGDIFWIDIDQCYTDGVATRNVFSTAYHNTLWGTMYGFHFSAKAFNRPGFLTMSNYGSPKTNLVGYDIGSGTMYGLGVLMDNDGDYWDEPQASLSRDGHSLVVNDNFGTSLNIDVYRIDF